MNPRAPMPFAEFDQCCGQCLAGIALDHYGAMESVSLDSVCENCPLLAEPRHEREHVLRDVRAL